MVERVAALLAKTDLDPGAGVQIVDAARLPSLAIDPTIALLLLASPEAPAAPLPGRHARVGVAAVLRGLYPAGHAAWQLAAGGRVPLSELDDGRLAIDDWLVPAVAPLEGIASPHGLPWIAARLRAPDGCPWDREQDHRSLRRFVLEEAYEAVDAIDRGTPSDLAEELGDVLLQVVLHAQLAAEGGAFDLTDVYRSIGAKIIRRHPHVFADVEVAGVDDVVRNWETLKRAEQADEGESRPVDTERVDADARRLERLLRAQPALPASRELQERASALGWDWTSIDGIWEKLDEELAELRASPPADRIHEVGDVLFAIVNLARWLEVDPEEALRLANRRWVARLAAVERLASERGLALGSMSAGARDELWQEAKRAIARDDRSATERDGRIPS